MGLLQLGLGMHILALHINSMGDAWKFGESAERAAPSGYYDGGRRDIHGWAIYSYHIDIVNSTSPEYMGSIRLNIKDILERGWGSGGECQFNRQPEEGELLILMGMLLMTSWGGGGGG